MKKIFKKLKKFILGHGNYGFLDASQMSKDNFIDFYIDDSANLDFITTADNKNLAKNHCGATAATNLGHYYIRDLDLDFLFKKFHNEIGNGPVFFISKKIQRTFKDLGKDLEYFSTRNVNEIKAALDQNHMGIFLLANGLFDWHYVVALGYRLYENGDFYLIIMDGWTKDRKRFYKINSGSLLLTASFYTLEGQSNLKDHKEKGRRMKKKYFLIFILMFLGALTFVSYALKNPQASISLPLSLLYSLYLFYIFLMFYFLYKALKK